MLPLLNRFRRPVRQAAAPATALAVLLALLVLEQRAFNRDSALLFALLTAVAVARLIPLGALAFAAGALLLQAFKVLPVVMVSGVLSYVAVPLAILFASLGYRGRRPWLLPVFAVASAGLITVNWFADATWVNFVFGAQLYGRGALRTGTPVTVDAPPEPAATALQQLTAYRLVQESLTNACRHGDRAKGATVTVRPGPGRTDGSGQL